VRRGYQLYGILRSPDYDSVGAQNGNLSLRTLFHCVSLVMNFQSYRASVAFLYANGKRRHSERLCLRLAKAVTEDLVDPHRALSA